MIELTAICHAFVFSRRKSARRDAFDAPLKTEGAGKTGCALHPRSRVQWVEWNGAHEHTGSAESIRPSLRNGFTAYNVLSPVIGLACHRRRRKLLSADLTPGSGRQDHTISPSASVPSVKDTSTSTATRPNVRDDGQRPSGGTKDDLPDGASGIFFTKGTRQQFADLPVELATSAAREQPLMPIAAAGLFPIEIAAVTLIAQKSSAGGLDRPAQPGEERRDVFAYHDRDQRSGEGQVVL